MTWGDTFKKLLSRKFLAFVVGTIAMFMGLIDGPTWALLAAAYVGINMYQKTKVGQ